MKLFSPDLFVYSPLMLQTWEKMLFQEQNIGILSRFILVRLYFKQLTEH